MADQIGISPPSLFGRRGGQSFDTGGRVCLLQICANWPREGRVYGTCTGNAMRKHFVCTYNAGSAASQVLLYIRCGATICRFTRKTFCGSLEYNYIVLHVSAIIVFAMASFKPLRNIYMAGAKISTRIERHQLVHFIKNHNLKTFFTICI